MSTKDRTPRPLRDRLDAVLRLQDEQQLPDARIYMFDDGRIQVETSTLGEFYLWASALGHDQVSAWRRMFRGVAEPGVHLDTRFDDELAGVSADVDRIPGMIVPVIDDELAAGTKFRSGLGRARRFPLSWLAWPCRGIVAPAPEPTLRFESGDGEMSVECVDCGTGLWGLEEAHRHLVDEFAREHRCEDELADAAPAEVVTSRLSELVAANTAALAETVRVRREQPVVVLDRRLVSTS